MNRKPKLPPILSGATNLAVQSSRSSRQCFVPETLSLPQIDLCSLCLQQKRKPRNSCEHNTRKACKNIDYPTFSFPHVYSVLPPIGKILEPSAPTSCRKTHLHSLENSTQHSDNNTTRRKRQASRKSRIKKQSSIASETKTVTEPVTQTAVVEDKSSKTTTQSSNEQNETLEIHISDAILEEESDLSNEANEAKTQPGEDDLLIARNIPAAFRLYADVYPRSPPPNERRSRHAVERKRGELKQDRFVLVGFMEGNSNERRNATCAELDEELKNAVELLKDIFLRQTMEELCMIW